jgi:hypothetical protein
VAHWARSEHVEPRAGKRRSSQSNICGVAAQTRRERWNRSDPRAMNADPRAMDADPLAMDADPLAMDADPLAMDADPVGNRRGFLGSGR